MQVKENGRIRYHLDDIAEDLAQRYNPLKASELHGLTGDFMEECALYPLVLAALNTGRFWGFDIEGYNSLVDFFAKTPQAETEMALAKGVINSDEDLAKLAEKGHLRKVEHDGRSVYFLSENIVRSAIR